MEVTDRVVVTRSAVIAPPVKPVTTVGRDGAFAIAVVFVIRRDEIGDPRGQHHDQEAANDGHQQGDHEPTPSSAAFHTPRPPPSRQIGSALRPFVARSAVSTPGVPTVVVADAAHALVAWGFPGVPRSARG
jgi:hypothetical protein